MAFKKGNSGNPQGRPAGTANKTTEAIRATVNQFISDNLPNIQAEYNNLESKDKLEFLNKLLAYTLPGYRLFKWMQLFSRRRLMFHSFQISKSKTF
ncbi:MAG: hypothetical protein IPH58_03405 [Sphingobacteriales bacterium]|nr:hypothetical protein [Sphingobacteriales bacterium]